MSQALHRHYLTQHFFNTFADVFADVFWRDFFYVLEEVACSVAGEAGPMDRALKGVFAKCIHEKFCFL